MASPTSATACSAEAAGVAPTPPCGTPTQARPEQQLAVGLSDKRHPKVGKTYVLKQVENRTEVEEGEQPERGVFEAKLTFKSATLVVVTVHLLDEVGTEISCDGGATWNLKRQS